MKILAIDPGCTESAYVIWDGKQIISHEKVDNKTLLTDMYNDLLEGIDKAYIEMVASYGMPVGREVFETVFWIGRFFQEINTQGKSAELVYRKDVKMHHCNSMKAKDSNIRQALIDKYGEPGTKKSPGVTHGLSGDEWSAFAIATYITERA